MRDGPDGVPGGRGHRGGFLPLAADVAEGDGPSVLHRENVVEVAADLQPLTRGQVPGGQVSFRAERCGRHLAAGLRGAGGRQLGRRVERGIQLDERGVEQGQRIGSGHRRGLAEGIAAPGQAGEVSVRAVRPGGL